MNRRTRMSLAVFAVFTLLSVTAALAADGKAQGTLTVNGKTTKLSYAYARAVPGFFDKTKEDVEVVLSDVPLDAKALDDVFERIHMAEAGKLHAFEITINAEATPISTSFRHNGFKDASPSGLSSEDVFTKKKFDANVVDATYKSAKPHEFFGNTYAFDVAFRTDIARKAKPVLPSAAEMAAAEKTAQAKVYRAFLKAVQNEDLGAMRKLMAKEEGKNLDGPDAKQMVKMIKAMVATDVKILKVVEKGDSAELSVAGAQDGNPATGTVGLVKEDGAWKIKSEQWHG